MFTVFCCLSTVKFSGDVKSLSPEKSPIAMKDTKWYTHNSTVGFMVAGIWNNRYYPTTSIISTVNRSAAHDLLVAGDTDGYIRLFRYESTHNSNIQ